MSPFFLLKQIPHILLYKCMIYLTTGAGNQTFKFLPRSYTAGTLAIRAEGVTEDFTSSIVTPTRVDYSGNTDTSGNYLSITHAFSPVLVEDTYYVLEIRNGSDVIYKDRIFCTDQTVSTYTVNSGQYTETSTDNDFIFV